MFIEFLLNVLVRPLGVSCIFVGFDKNENDLSIMLSDPLGDYSSWSCISIGKDSGNE